MTLAKHKSGGDFRKRKDNQKYGGKVWCIHKFIYIIPKYLTIFINLFHIWFKFGKKKPTSK